ncbi:unnamed protein product [Discosporangium mesarthrocarpum]
MAEKNGGNLNDLEMEVARSLAASYRPPQEQEAYKTHPPSGDTGDSRPCLPSFTVSSPLEGLDSGRVFEADEERDDQEEDVVSDEEEVGEKRKRMSAEDRKARNRERNRLHARKTRQRKKEHVQELLARVWELREERQFLVQLAAEHRTAGFLLALSGTPPSSPGARDNGQMVAPSQSSLCGPPPKPRDWDRELEYHQKALRKITQQFEKMDGSNVGEEGEVDGEGGGKGYINQCKTKGRGGKGQSAATADRTELRRERNRMHAKRTRNRKKLFVEACGVIIGKMIVENARLEAETRAAGVHVPSDLHARLTRGSVSSEPLPEDWATLWDFAEGRAPGTTPRGGRSNRTRSPSPLQVIKSGMRSASSDTPLVPVVRNTVGQCEPKEAPQPAQALEDAEALCAFSRAAKQPRLTPKKEAIPVHRNVKQWSDHGSTTSESRGSSDEDEPSNRREVPRLSTIGAGVRGLQSHIPQHSSTIVPWGRLYGVEGQRYSAPIFTV